MLRTGPLVALDGLLLLSTCLDSCLLVFLYMVVHVMRWVPGRRLWTVVMNVSVLLSALIRVVLLTNLDPPLMSELRVGLLGAPRTARTSAPWRLIGRAPDRV